MSDETLGEVPSLLDDYRLEAYLQSLKTFSPPPERFDPQKASDRQLQLYGYPRRPNKEKEAHLRVLWDKACLRPHRRIQATLAIDRTLTDRRSALHPGPNRDHHGKFGPSGWGGVVELTSDFGFTPAQPANVVYGEWAVPTMQPDFDNPNTPMTVGFWVGIDGFGNGQVLQAGTAATVTGSSMDYWSWFEWFPDPAVRFNNFPIAPGDLVTVLICAPQNNHGFASFLNRTTGVATSVGIPPPGGTTSMGAMVEWIVEGISADLPNFGAVTFLNCSAGTKNHTMNLSYPIITEIGGFIGPLTSSSAQPRSSSVNVVWQGLI